ncbi:MAG: outer membrane beta-barrel family protein, partial [Bacteroidaceae bacterium]|nr:outer membrane beta-barrel family protein [Bacteroidaceae bacterium]
MKCHLWEIQWQKAIAIVHVRLPFAKAPFSFSWNLKYNSEHNRENIRDTLNTSETQSLRKDLQPKSELNSNLDISKELKTWKGKSLRTTLGLKYHYGYFRTTGERLRMLADPSVLDDGWIAKAADCYNTITYSHSNTGEMSLDMYEKHGWNFSSKLRGGYTRRGIHDVRRFIYSQEFSLGDFEPGVDIAVRGKGVSMQYLYYKMRPEMPFMLPVTENKDIYDTWYGNPNLKNGSSHLLMLYYSKGIQKRQQLIGAGITISLMPNVVRYAQDMDPETGVVVHMPRNVNGEWKSSAYINYNCRVDKPGNLRLSSKLDFNSQRAMNFSYDATMKNSMPIAIDNFAVNGELKLDYLGTKSLRASAIANIRHRIQEKRYMQTHIDWTDYTYGLNINYALGKHVNLSTDLMAYTHSGYISNDMNTTEWVWNASASYSFGKQRNWSLRA